MLPAVSFFGGLLSPSKVVAIASSWRSRSLPGYYHRVDSKSLPMGEREVRERHARMEARADVADRLVEEAKPTRMVGAGAVGGTPPWFTLLLVPVFGPVDIFNPAEFTLPVLHTVVPRARTEMPGRLTVVNRPFHLHNHAEYGRLCKSNGRYG